MTSKSSTFNNDGCAGEVAIRVERLTSWVRSTAFPMAQVANISG
jgi:hypothetical protein